MKTLAIVFYTLKKKNFTFHKNFSVIISLALIFSGISMPGLISTCHPQSPWSQKSDMLNARFGHSSIVLNGKIHTLGGVTTTSGVAYKTVKVYDPLLDSWAPRADMITGRTCLATCIVDGKILAIGGGQTFYSGSIISIEEYDPATNTWTYKTDLPRARCAHTASLVNGKVYIIGGWSGDWDDVSEVDVYDTLTKTWTTVSNLPTPRSHLAAVTLNGKIYAIGGVTDPDHGETSLRTVEEYDPVTDTWTTKANMITDRKSASVCVLNGKIYAFGGGSGMCTPPLSSVEVYDPETNIWSEINDMPTILAGHSVAIVNGKAFFSGGVISTCPATAISTTYEYDPHLDLSPLIEGVNVSRSYAKPGVDSVLITAKINDPQGITLMGEIEAPDQIPVDSLLLYDDGNHNDGSEGDSLFANVWQVSSAEEQNYYMDLKVTRIDADTVIHLLNNMATFTTIGPVNFESYTFTGEDVIPNPGDKVKVKITLRNNGTTATATNVYAELISLDTLISVLTTARRFGDIAAGENLTYSGYFSIEISEECPVNTQIPIIVDITGNNYIYPSDTFFILIQEPTGIKDIREQTTRIYPNPTDNMLNIEISNTVHQALEIEIFTITGNVIYCKEYKNINANYIEQLDLSDYTNGVYLLKVRQADEVHIEKVVVK